MRHAGGVVSVPAGASLAGYAATYNIAVIKQGSTLCRETVVAVHDDSYRLAVLQPLHVPGGWG